MKSFQKEKFIKNNFAYADLRDYNFEGAVLFNSRLYEADIRFCDLERANLSGSDLSGADLRGIKWDDNTIWPEGYELVRKP